MIITWKYANHMKNEFRINVKLLVYTFDMKVLPDTLHSDVNLLTYSCGSKQTTNMDVTCERVT